MLLFWFHVGSVVLLFFGDVFLFVVVILHHRFEVWLAVSIQVICTCQKNMIVIITTKQEGQPWTQPTKLLTAVFLIG